MTITSIASRRLARATVVLVAAVAGWFAVPLAAHAAAPPITLTGAIQTGGKIGLAFDGSHPRLVGLALRRLRFTCDDGSVDAVSLSSLSATDYERVAQGRFTTRLSLPADDVVYGGGLVVRGTITSYGVRGTVSGVEQTRAHGTCRTGLVRWVAMPR